MCQKNSFDFTLAVAGFRANPTVNTLTILTHVGLSLIAPTVKVAPFPSRQWLNVHDRRAFYGDFSEIRIVIDRWLKAEEIMQVMGAVGYAFRQVLCGEELGEPHVVQSIRAGQTILIASFDSTKSRRDDPDFAEAFERAEEYIREGSPLRTTNRAGAGTRGTRLVEGLGQVAITFAVR